MSSEWAEVNDTLSPRVSSMRAPTDKDRFLLELLPKVSPKGRCTCGENEGVNRIKQAKSLHDLIYRIGSMGRNYNYDK